MQQFFENELLGKKADSIKKLMKLVCDMTGEDVEQLTQQSMAIRNPENASLGCSWKHSWHLAALARCVCVLLLAASKMVRTGGLKGRCFSHEE